MDIPIVIIQLVIALGIFNVWILRMGKKTGWRGGNATTMREEFAVYGLPGWFMATVGSLKLLFAILLIIGIWIPGLARPAAAGMAILMVGAVSMHFKVRDPLKKSLPALTMLLLSLIVVLE